MVTCQGKTKDGRLCSRTARGGTQYCWQHEPEVFRPSLEVYKLLEGASPEEKIELVLHLVEESPEGKLILPERNGVHANLRGINLSQEVLKARKCQNQEKLINLFALDANHPRNTSPHRSEGIVLVGKNLDDNLRNIDLQGADLEEANFQGTHLFGVNLKNANLENANFKGAFLVAARLCDTLGNVNLENTNLEGADMRSAGLIGANLQNAYMGSVDLQDALLHEANMQGVNLENANLVGASLGKEILLDISFQAANLQRANLRNTNLQGVNLRSVNLQGANLEGADLQGADLEDANLQNANLWAANLQKANLRGANLQNANLENAELQKVVLYNCNNLNNIFIAGAWLEKTMLRHEQLGRAIGEELAGSYGNARLGYLFLKKNFDEIGDYEAASWSYIRERKMEKWEAFQKARVALTLHRWQEAMFNGAKFIGDTLVEVVSNYGEGFWRVLLWIIGFIFIIGPALFWTWGRFEWSQSSEEYYFSFPYRWQQYLYTYYQLLPYTIDTFTTANFAELRPNNAFARFVSGGLAMLGIFLVGLLGFVAGNRIRRS